MGAAPWLWLLVVLVPRTLTAARAAGEIDAEHYAAAKREVFGLSRRSAAVDPDS